MIRMPHITSNISNMTKDGVIASQLYRFSRLCTSKSAFVSQLNSVRATKKVWTIFLSSDYYVFGMSSPSRIHTYTYMHEHSYCFNIFCLCLSTCFDQIQTLSPKSKQWRNYHCFTLVKENTLIYSLKQKYNLVSIKITSLWQWRGKWPHLWC